MYTAIEIDINEENMAVRGMFTGRGSLDSQLPSMLDSAQDGSTLRIYRGEGNRALDSCRLIESYNVEIVPATRTWVKSE